MPAPLTHAQFETPFGSLHVFADDHGVVRASGFGDVHRIAAHLPVDVASAGWVDSALPHIEHVVAAWLDGDADAITSVAVEQPGSDFLQDVWRAMSAVKGGEPITYGELAIAAGRPGAARAVGTACARNAVAPFVPCHRVLSSGYRVGAYGYGGAPIKAAMLALESGASPTEIADAGRTATPDTHVSVRTWQQGA